MLGLGLGLASAALRGTAWRPGWLFKEGQSGLWGNIQEGRPMRLFQDAAGTIPAYEAGQPVGKVARAAGTVDASQATALSRPTLARWPKGGRRNLLTWTEDLNNVIWAKESCSVSDGGNGAWKLREREGLPINGNTGHNLRYNNPGLIPAASTRPLTIEVKAAERTCIAIHGRSATAWGWQAVNLLTGEVVAGRSGGNTNVTIKSAVQLEDGWWRIVADVRILWINGPGSFCLSPALPISSADSINYEGDGSSGVLIRFPQLEVGPDATPYQRVTTAFDITEAGVPDVWHLWNDGGDSLPAILPAGNYEIAWVNHLGAVSYASATSDGTTGTDLLRAERMADVLVREGAFTATEKTALEAYWSQRYAA